MARRLACLQFRLQVQSHSAHRGQFLKQLKGRLYPRPWSANDEGRLFQPNSHNQREDSIRPHLLRLGKRNSCRSRDTVRNPN